MTIKYLDVNEFESVDTFSKGFEINGQDIVILSYRTKRMCYGYEHIRMTQSYVVLCSENGNRTVYQEAAKHIVRLNSQLCDENQAGWLHSLVALGSQDYIKKMILECVPEEEKILKEEIEAELLLEKAIMMQRETEKQTALFLQGIGQYDKSDYTESGWKKIVDTWKTKYPLAEIPA